MSNKINGEQNFNGGQTSGSRHDVNGGHEVNGRHEVNSGQFFLYVITLWIAVNCVRH